VPEGLARRFDLFEGFLLHLKIGLDIAAGAWLSCGGE
jgi:hypothetical protein